MAEGEIKRTPREIEKAKKLVVGQLAEIQHALERRLLSGDNRTFLLFERTYLRGMADMAAYVSICPQSPSELVKLITQERMGFLTGEIETGALHVHPVRVIELDEEAVLDQEGEQKGGNGG